MAWWTLYKREIGTYFQSVVAYVVLFGSALVQSISFIFIVSVLADKNYKEQSAMQIFFTWPLFWMLLFIQIPLVTMRVFSEEFKLGTIEMLLTAPVSEWDVVIAKFLGAFTFFLVLWLPSALDFTALQLFSSNPAPIIWSEVWITAMIVALVGSLYVSIGLFSSVLTRNQIVAAVICFALLSCGFGLSLIRWMDHTSEQTLAWVNYVSMPEHFQAAVQGLFDTRPIVFYLSTTICVLFLTQRVLQARRLQA